MSKRTRKGVIINESQELQKLTPMAMKMKIRMVMEKMKHPPGRWSTKVKSGFLLKIVLTMPKLAALTSYAAGGTRRQRMRRVLQASCAAV